MSDKVEVSYLKVNTVPGITNQLHFFQPQTLFSCEQLLFVYCTKVSRYVMKLVVLQNNQFITDLFYSWKVGWASGYSQLKFFGLFILYNWSKLQLNWKIACISLPNMSIDWSFLYCSFKNSFRKKIVIDNCYDKTMEETVINKLSDISVFKWNWWSILSIKITKPKTTNNPSPISGRWH